MTNKPMLSVERELLDRIARPLKKMADEPARRRAIKELRALLDKPARPVPECVGDLERFEADDGVFVRLGDVIDMLGNEKAAQHQGEPVAWVNGEQLRLCAKSPRHDEPGSPMLHNLPRNIGGSALRGDYCDTPLFAGPPAPVAVVHTMKSIMEAVEASRCYTVLTSDQCHALAQSLNGVKP